jgi:uncharacterized protein (DUF1810 family)
VGSAARAEDQFDLARFLTAQETGRTYDGALAELRAGRKTSHWMWFVFPQLTGLGHSEMSRRYAISGEQEARAYLAHPMLGPRLTAAAEALTGLDSHDPERVLGPVDALKLHSSMTLFAAVAQPDSVFEQVLEQYFGGSRDQSTQRLLT